MPRSRANGFLPGGLLEAGGDALFPPPPLGRYPSAHICVPAQARGRVACPPCPVCPKYFCTQAEFEGRNRSVGGEIQKPRDTWDTRDTRVRRSAEVIIAFSNLAPKMSRRCSSSSPIHRALQPCGRVVDVLAPHSAKACNLSSLSGVSPPSLRQVPRANSLESLCRTSHSLVVHRRRGCAILDVSGHDTLRRRRLPRSLPPSSIAPPEDLKSGLKSE